MPAAQPGKRVGAHQAKQSAIGREPGAQAVEGLQRIVGRARGLGGIGQGDREAWLAGYGQPGHGQAVSERGRRTPRLERLRADRGEEDGVEAERRPGSARHGQMAQMGRVETAAEEGDPLAAWELFHLSIVSCTRRGYAALW